MNRCLPRKDALGSIALCAALALSAALTPSVVSAQEAAVQTQNEAAVGGRNFPIGTLRGTFEVTAWPRIRLDGRDEQLAPGARIYSAQHMLVMPAAITGQRVDVNYRRDAAGLVRDVWILTAAEEKAKRASADRPLLNFWPFASSESRVNSNTPFNELPRYGQ